ncbi:MAG: efflux RND transporter periplasmic adaptor subunit, partial [Acidobacteriota bacterium]
PAAGAGRGRGGAALDIQTAPVGRLAIERRADLSGTLVSPDQAQVSSEVAGIVRDVPVQLGTEVRAGDALVRLDTRELAIAVERAASARRQAEAQLGMAPNDPNPPADAAIAFVQQAQANRDDAKATYDRAANLSGRGLVAQADRDTAETRMKVAEANYRAAIDNVAVLRATLQDRRAAHDLAEKKLADAVIRAPVSGAVSERLVQTGEFLRENTQVVTIVQLNPLKLRTSIQERYASAIHPGQAVDFAVEAFPDRKFEGTIAYVSPAIDQGTRTFAIEALVKNDDRTLKPGFFAKGTVALRVDQNVMAVPENAVSTLAGVSTVYVIADGKARQQIVSLGAHEGDQWEIVAGLKGDEVVATSALNQLATGMTVNTGGKAAGRPAAKEPDAAPAKGPTP